MKISINRRRWVIIRNGTDIFCGLARNFQFKPISNVGNTAIKTYLSKDKALSSFASSWNQCDKDNYEAVEVTESLTFPDNF